MSDEPTLVAVAPKRKRGRPRRDPSRPAVAPVRRVYTPDERRARDQAMDEAAREAIARAAAGELLGPTELGAILRVRPTQYHKLLVAGDLEKFKAKPPIGTKCFSGILITRYLHGEPLYEPTFGKKRRA